MLEIIVDTKYTLHLPEDIDINFIEENPLFLNDRIPAPYSLSFEVPATPGNLMAFGFPNRVTSKTVKKVLPVEIRHTGLILGRGDILLLEVTDVLKLQFSGSRSSVNLKARLDKIDISEHTYGQFKHDPELLNYESPITELYVQSMPIIAHTANPFVLAPVRKTGAEWWGEEGSNGAINSLKQYINYFNPKTENFLIEYISANKFRSPILPFPYVYKIIDAVFGDYLESNPFAEGDLAKLVVISMNHKFNDMEHLLEYYNVGGSERPFPAFYPLLDNYDENESGNVDIIIRLKYFMQQYFFNNFLKELLKIFCMVAYPGPVFKIEFANDVMDRSIQVLWDHKLAGDPVITYEEGKEYVFKYSNVESSKDDEPVLSFPNVKAIFDAAFVNTNDEQTTYKDESTGAKFTINRTLKGVDSVVILTSTIKHSPLSSQEVETDKTKFELVSEVRPAGMNIHDYWERDYFIPSPHPRKYWFIPQVTNNGFEDPPYIMFWGGFRNTLENNGYAYPSLMSHHTDHFGVKRLNTSLHPDGTDGLIEKFHGKLKAWYAKDKMKVKGSFRLSVFDIYKLDIRDKVSFQGKLFYIQKLSYTLTNTAISLVDVDLIEA